MRDGMETVPYKFFHIPRNFSRGIRHYNSRGGGYDEPAIVELQVTFTDGAIEDYTVTLTRQDGQPENMPYDRVIFDISLD